MMDALKDPDLLVQAKKMNVDVEPLDGERLQQLVVEATQLQPEMVSKIRAVIAANSR